MLGYQEFIEQVVRSIVEHPEEVRVEKIVDERGVLLMLHVHPSDLGYVIGKKGQTVTSLRTLLRIVGAKHNARVTLKVDEPQGNRERPSVTVAANRVDTSIVDNLQI